MNEEMTLVALKKVNAKHKQDPFVHASARNDYLQLIQHLKQAGHVDAIPVLVQTAKVFAFDAVLCRAAQDASKHLSPVSNPRDPYGVFRI